jgi:hypothetical protein
VDYNESQSRIMSDTNTSVTCAVVIFDFLDSSSRSLFEVSVEGVMEVSDIRIFLLSGINRSRVTANSDDLKSTMSLTSSVLNHVNCLGAPNCMSLNRLACSLVEGTCGACLFGYAGQMGSSNTPCLAMTQANHRMLGTSTSISTGQICGSDDDCNTSGMFLECNSHSKVCQSIQQSCPNSCSGHGRCLFRSRYNRNVTLSHCAISDTECIPSCDCDNGFDGASCSTPADTFLSAVEIRQFLVEGVAELMQRENADALNVKSWTQILSLIGSDDLSLSSSSKRTTAALAIEILKISDEIDLSIEDLFVSGMEAVLDICVSELSSAVHGSFDDALLASLLEEYSEFLTSDMLEAQNPVSSITLNFRSSSFFISPLSKSTDTSLNTSSPLLLLVPDTASEIFFKNAIQGSGVAQQSIELSPHLLFPLQISLTETLDRYTTVVIPKNDTNQTTTESQLSLPLFVSLQGSPCPPSGQSCQLTARLQNNRMQSSLQESRNLITSSKSSPLNSTRSYFEIDCVAGVAEDHYFRCPSGALMLISCNGSSTLRGRKHCPNISSTVLCRTKVQAATSTSSSEIDCQLAEYNSTITITIWNRGPGAPTCCYFLNSFGSKVSGR